MLFLFSLRFLLNSDVKFRFVTVFFVFSLFSLYSGVSVTGVNFILLNLFLSCSILLLFRFVIISFAFSTPESNTSFAFSTLVLAADVALPTPYFAASFALPTPYFASSFAFSTPVSATFAALPTTKLVAFFVVFQPVVILFPMNEPTELLV